LAYNDLGTVYYKSNRIDDGVKAVEKALQIDPDCAFAYNNLGYFYFNFKNYEKALELFEKSVEINPDNYPAYTNLGLVHNTLENYPKAVEAYKRAIEIKSDDALIFNNLGFALERGGRSKEAEEVYKTAINIDQNCFEAYNNLGLIYSDSKNYRGAIRLFDKAIEINPEYDEAYIHKGILLKLIKSGKSKIKHYVIKNIDSCYIAFFDILGFKDLVNNNSHEDLKKLYFKDFDFSISASLCDVKASIIGPIERAINSFTISDSIIFWTNNDSLESFFVLFTAASTLMISSLVMGLPLRGSITAGELSMTHGFYDYNKSSIKSSLIGKPIVNAYELEKQQNWSGCVIDDKCIKLYLEAIKKRKLTEEDPYGISNLLNSDLIVKYNVPFKNNKSKNSKYLTKYVINWTKGGIFQHYSASELERKFSEHNKNIERDDVKEKIKNTVDFYNKMKNE